MDRGKVGLREHRGDCAAPVLLNRGAVVIATVTDVETFELAARNASTTAEKAVRNIAERAGPNDLDAAQSTFRMMMSSSA